MEREKLASQEARSLIESETLRKANDVNNNNQADLVESKQLEVDSRERIEDKKLVRKDKELELKEKDIELKSKKETNKAR